MSEHPERQAAWSPDEERRIAEVRENLRLGASIMRYLRETLGMSQAEVAAALSTTQSNVSKLEQRPDVELGKIAALLKSRGGEVKLVATLDDRVLELPL